MKEVIYYFVEPQRGEMFLFADGLQNHREVWCFLIRMDVDYNICRVNGLTPNLQAVFYSACNNVLIDC